MPSAVATEAPPATAAPRRIGRWHRVVHRAYLVVYSFLGLNVVAGFIQALVTSGRAALPTWEQIQQIYLVQLAFNAPYVLWPLLAALVFLGIAGPIYDRWLTAEEERLLTAKTHQVATSAARDVVAPVEERVNLIEERVEALGNAPPAVDSGPPFDMLPTAPHFIGRAEEIAQITAALRSGQVAAITAVRGVGGIGKTTLAAEVARQQRDAGAFPDGVLFVVCQQRRTAEDAQAVLRDILTRFARGRQLPEAADWDALTAVARQLLQGKRALIVLDNIEPELPPDAPRRLVGALHDAGAVLLLTARQELPRDIVPPATGLELNVLPLAQAVDLFAQPFAPARPDDAVLARIVTALGRHTLAIQLVAGYAADTRAGDLPALAGELEANPRLALAIQGDDPQRDLEPIFTGSYDALTAPAPGPGAHAQRLFIALAAFGTPEFGRRAALAPGTGLGLSDTEADNALTLLKRRALLAVETADDLPEAADRNRVRLHPLLRAFAAERLDQWPAPDQDAAHRAIAAFYGNYANNNGFSYPVLAIDEANISDAIEWAHDHDQGALVVHLCLGMRNYWRDRSLTALSRRYLQWGVAAAQTLAEQTHERADQNRLADLLIYRGALLETLGQTNDAERDFQQSLAIWQKIGENRGAAIALSNLGDILMQRGDLAGAEANYQQCRQIMHAVGDQRAEGVALYKLAILAERQNDLERAEELHRASLAIGERVENKQDVADSLMELGRFLIQRRGRVEEGCGMLQRAATLYDEMGMPQAQQARDLIQQLGCGA